MPSTYQISVYESLNHDSGNLFTDGGVWEFDNLSVGENGVILADITSDKALTSLTLAVTSPPKLTKRITIKINHTVFQLRF